MIRLLSVVNEDTMMSQVPMTITPHHRHPKK